MRKISIISITRAESYFHSTISSRTFRNIYLIYSSCVTNQLANSVQDPKVTITSDQIFLPRIAENSIPVYESVGEYANTLRMVNKIFLSLPIFILATAHMPFIAFTAFGLHYFIYFKVNFKYSLECICESY
jgi:hypothetical protein